MNDQYCAFPLCRNRLKEDAKKGEFCPYHGLLFIVSVIGILVGWAWLFFALSDSTQYPYRYWAFTILTLSLFYVFYSKGAR